MAKIELDETFKNYLLSSYPIDESLLNSLLDDMGEYLLQDVGDFIFKRHREMQKQGVKNERIYEKIQKELKTRSFAGPELSLRQIRRAIYG